MDREIMCITRKAPPTEDCTCIQYVGTVDSDYLLPVSEVIKRIEKSKDQFYVLEHETQDKIYVHIAHKGNLKYIRTEARDTSDDELLKVGDCDVTDKPVFEKGSMLLIGIEDLLRSKLTRRLNR
ncbi:MAG TPA: hypothetical protein VJ730_02670 [Nitrososphaera sp.]|nr:hypothetical protein [Nitrososphaera sp.]